MCAAVKLDEVGRNAREDDADVDPVRDRDLHGEERPHNRQSAKHPDGNPAQLVRPVIPAPVVRGVCFHPHPTF